MNATNKAGRSTPVVRRYGSIEAFVQRRVGNLPIYAGLLLAFTALALCSCKRQPSTAEASEQESGGTGWANTNKAASSSGTRTRLPGRELRVRIDSIDKGSLDDASRANGFALAADQLNAGVTQPVASADESAGIMHIAFGYDSSDWPFVGNRPFPPTRILVALYDKNRQLLTHFTTQEAFVPKEFAANFPIASETLMAEGNHLQYAVNARDLAFAEHVLIGFETGPVVIDRRERLRSIMVPPIKQRWAEAMKPLEEELSRSRTTYRIGNSFDGDEETGSSNRLANAKRDLEELREAHASRQASLLEREGKWRKDLDTLLESKRQTEARGQWFSQQWNLETAQQRLAIVEKEKDELRLLDQDISNREAAMPDLAAACTLYRDTWNRLRELKQQEKAELERAEAEIRRTINAE